MIGRSWFHPLKILLVGFMIVIVAYFGFSTFLAVCATMTTNLEWAKKDWPFTIAGTIWISVFSSAIVGVGVNLMNALMVGVGTTNDFDMLKTLTKAEAAELNEWLNSHTYELGHLKELWGETNE